MRPGADAWKKGRVCERCGHVRVLNSPHDCEQNLAERARETQRYRQMLAEAETAGDTRAAAAHRITLARLEGR